MIQYERRFQVLALGFAALAGYIDAIGFLSSGGLFVSFMSGNSTRLAIGTARTNDIGLAAAALIVLFVLGVIVNALVGGLCGDARRKWAAASTVAALLVAAAILQTIEQRYTMLGVLALAMGAANTIFQRGGDVAIGVTYMTGALVKLGLRLAAALRGQDRWGWVPYLLLWLSLIGGGIAGALAFVQFPNRCLWGAALFAIALALAAARLSRGRPA